MASCSLRTLEYEKGRADGFREAIVMLVTLSLFLLVAGYLGGIERGTIPLPWEM